MKKLVVALSVVAVSAFGLVAPADARGSAKPDKVTVCHNGDDGIKAITVAASAVAALLARGDTLPDDGECSIAAEPGPLEVLCADGTFTNGQRDSGGYFAECEIAWELPRDVDFIAGWDMECASKSGTTYFVDDNPGPRALICEGPNPLS
jgi:hypothetical protein